MSFQPGSNLYGVGVGTVPENVEVPHIDVRSPTSSDVNYPVGKRWINSVAGLAFSLNSFTSIGGTVAAVWGTEGTVSGPLNTLTGDSGGAIAPLAGNIDILGTAGEIVTTGAGAAIIVSVPSAFIAPGSIASTTTITAGTGLVATTTLGVGTNALIGGTLGVTGKTTLGAADIDGTVNINTAGAGVTTIGTGGTGATNIGNATGNTAVTGSLAATTGLSTSTGNIVATAGQVNAGTTMTAGTGITATTGNIVATAGQVNAGTSMTAGTGVTATTGGVTASAGNIVATLGDITASAGNISATLGSVGAGTTVTAGTGITATTGNITASAGNLIATLGSVSAGTTVTGGTGVIATTGDVAASAGNVTAVGNVVAAKSAAGATVSVQATNGDNTNAASNAQVQIAVGGTSGGSPSLLWQVSGAATDDWAAGADNANSYRWCLSEGDVIGTTDAIRVAHTTLDVEVVAGDVVVTAGDISTTAGAITSATTLTATLGAITATNGNVVLGTAGNKIVSSSVASNTATAGANSFGTTTLIGGQATITTTAVTANSLIMIWRQSIGSTGANAIGHLVVGTITAATSFVINSVSSADATALVGSDVSKVGWVIIN